MAKKVRVGLLFGGRSPEHPISIRSARSLVAALDRDRFTPVLIGIDPSGRWHLVGEDVFRQLEARSDERGPNEIVPTALRHVTDAERPRSDDTTAVDVVFPILHGAYGEDGTIQGMLEMLDLPYVGAGVLGSAVGMDKDVQKRLLRAADIAVVPFLTVQEGWWQRAPQEVEERALDLGLPLFVKPANLGSSVGVHRVATAADLRPAILDALSYDPKVLIEKGIDAREIECSVLGNEQPQASVPGEIVAGADFYSYDEKYSNSSNSELRIPAPLSAEMTARVRAMAVRTFEVLECSGMARVDFFLDRDSDHLYVNELNSIPGFTSISMYPKLWEATGLSYRDLITRLIELAFERHATRERLRDPGSTRRRPLRTTWK
jgi:D-alanine-D-alanine ligase